MSNLSAEKDFCISSKRHAHRCEANTLGAPVMMLAVTGPIGQVIPFTSEFDPVAAWLAQNRCWCGLCTQRVLFNTIAAFSR